MAKKLVQEYKKDLTTMTSSTKPGRMLIRGMTSGIEYFKKWILGD
jgi:hypothetical protein